MIDTRARARAPLRSRRGWVARIGRVAVAGMLISAGAAAEEPVYSITAVPPGTERPVIDGLLDDPAWRSAQPLSALRQVVPVAGAVPTEETEIRLLFDERSIFVLLDCRDSDPERIRATQLKRDARLGPDDRVELFFDTFLDRRNAFWFQIGAGGSKGDALIARNGSRFNKDWDGIWYGQSRVTERGWQAELEIPLATLNFDQAGTSWGFNVRRFIRRREEEARWASPTPRLQFFSVAHAGTLQGLAGLQQGLGLDVVPFVVGDWLRDRTTLEQDLEEDVGLDLFYKVTPSTKVSLSINTDFAETEVDDRQINLTRFDLFFPEKRDFFLEDSSTFEFGPDNRDAVPFFSRRIGLDDNDNEVPLRTAVKVTTQTDSFSAGILDVQTSDTSSIDSRNLLAARFSKNIFDQSDIGLVYTRGNPTENTDQDQTVGVDMNLRTDSFLGDKNLRFTTFVQESRNEGSRGSDDAAWFASVDYPNDEIDLSFQYLGVDDDFEPELGRAPRTGIRSYFADLNYRPRLYGDIRQLRFSLEPRLVTNEGNDTESVEIEIQPVGILWESGDQLELKLTPRREVLDADFNLQGVIVPAGSYDFRRFEIEFESSNKRQIELAASYVFGSFFDGYRQDVNLGVGIRASSRVLVDIEYEFNDVDLDGGSFDVHVARTRVELQFTPRVSWSNFFQYDNLSDQLGLNSRMWWIVEPGRELFFVVNQGWEAGGGDYAPVVTELTAKVGYTFRY